PAGRRPARACSAASRSFPRSFGNLSYEATTRSRVAGVLRQCGGLTAHGTGAYTRPRAVAGGLSRRREGAGGAMEIPFYDYSPIVRRPRLELPNGARVAFWIGVNIEHYAFGQRALSLAQCTSELVPDPLNYGWPDYAARVGSARR